MSDSTGEAVDAPSRSRALVWLSAWIVAALILVLLIRTLASSAGAEVGSPGDPIALDRAWAWAEVRSTGGVPLWNPYAMGGLPLIPSGAFAPFYPLSWFAAILPYAWALNIEAFIHLVLGAALMGWVMRRMGIAHRVAGLIALVWMTAGAFATRLDPVTLPAFEALCYLPLAVYGAARLSSRDHRRAILASSLAFTLQALTGAFAILFGSLLIWLAVKALADFFPRVFGRREAEDAPSSTDEESRAPDAGWSRGLTTLGAAGLILLFTVSISAVSWIPAWEFRAISTPNRYGSSDRPSFGGLIHRAAPEVDDRLALSNENLLGAGFAGIDEPRAAELQPLRVWSPMGLARTSSDDPLYDVQLISGHAPRILRDYDRLLEALGAENPNLLDLFAVNCVILDAAQSIGGPLASSLAGDFVEVGRLDSAAVHVRREPIFIRQTRHWAIVQTREELFARLAHPDHHSLESTLMVRGEMPEDWSGEFSDVLGLSFGDVDLRVTPQPSDAGEVAFDYQSLNAAWVQIAVPAVPGWRTEIDGEFHATKPLLADGLFLNCELISGRHSFRLVYDPASQRLGSYVSLLSLGLLAGGIGRRYAREKKSAGGGTAGQRVLELKDL